MLRFIIFILCAIYFPPAAVILGLYWMLKWVTRVIRTAEVRVSANDRDARLNRAIHDAFKEAERAADWAQYERKQEIDNEGFHDFGDPWDFEPEEPAYSAEQLRAYKTLGVSIGAEKETILAAYRQLVKSAHPDHGGSEARTLELNIARDILVKRAVSA